MSEPIEPETPKRRARLERHVRTRINLIRDLATSDMNQIELAAKYGCVQSAISEFTKRHADDIMALRAKADDEFVSLWAANKVNRIAEVQQVIEDITTHAEWAQELDERAAPDVELLRVKLAALRQISEELGQLPARVTHKIEGSITTIIEGVDHDALK